MLNLSVDTRERVTAAECCGSRARHPSPAEVTAPIVLSAWAHQLTVQTTTDGRLQPFIDAFRVNPQYTPEYGASCDDQPPATGGRPLCS